MHAFSSKDTLASADVIRAIAATAHRWCDPDYEVRARAEEAELSLANRFTAEAVIFAVNQQMQLITEERLTSWSMPLNAKGTTPLSVGVLNAGNVPLAGLQDLLAVLITGNRYVGVLSSRAAALLPAFTADCLGELALDRLPDLARFCGFEEMLGSVDVLIASGSDDAMQEVRVRAISEGLPGEQLMLRGHRYGVAILDGNESKDELVGIAEDILLHEGLVCRNVAVVFAPEKSAPDNLLEAMAVFRGTFPAHKATIGSLKIPKAMLEAVDTPHGYGEGLEFLLSKGDPEPQSPGHCRWAEYDSLESCIDWIHQHANELQVVSAVERIALNPPDGVERVTPGNTQRPEMEWKPDGKSTVEFLRDLQNRALE